MQRPETIAGLLLAAFAHAGGEAPLRDTALATDLAARARERLVAIGAEDPAVSREHMLAALARQAVDPPLDALPSSPRAAALLAPIATQKARAAAVALPMPRRGYRPPPGLRDHLRRLTAADLRARRAAEERARVEARAWPA